MHRSRGDGDKPSRDPRKPRSSIAVGSASEEGKSDAFISAGTPGRDGCEHLLLRLHPGVQRPAIGRSFRARASRSRRRRGRNVDCDARELVGFAHLGPCTRATCWPSNPTVGLLNIGEEDEKGNAVVKEAHQLLKQTPGSITSATSKARNSRRRSARQAPGRRGV